MQKFRLFVGMLLMHSALSSVELGNTLKEEISAPKVRILLGLDATARHKNVENLKTEMQLLHQQWKDFVVVTDQKIAEITNQISDLATLKGTKNLSLIQN